ncbi:hypothetical protein BH11MYX4_BH11MYX4_23900 [soil metagenome]|jgi:uncharacterized protein (DUF697 family)
MNKLVQVLRSLLKNTTGNGEIVGALVVVGICVTLGLLAVKTLGEGSRDKATQQATAIKALPGQ